MSLGTNPLHYSLLTDSDVVSRFADCVVVEVAYGADMVADSRIERHIELVEEVTRKLAAMGDTSFLDLLPFCELVSVSLSAAFSFFFLLIYK